MIAVAICCLGLLAGINYQVSGKRLLYPATVFCTVWTATLSVVALMGSSFYPLGFSTLSIIILGGVAFSLGSLIGSMAGSSFTPVESASPGVLLTWVVAASLMMVPLYLKWIVQLASQFGAPNILTGAKLALFYSQDFGTLGRLFQNLIPFSIAIALASVLESKRAYKRSILAVSVAVFVNLLTGARSGVTTLLLCLLAVDWMKNRRFRYRFVLLSCAGILVAFFLIAVLLAKGGDPNATVAENVNPVFSQLGLYSAGGIVAFDRAVRNPASVMHTQKISEPFIPILNFLGARLPAPLSHIDTNFVTVGPDSMTNVYTVFFSYFEWGPVWCMILFGLTGFLITLCFEKAMAGSKTAMLVYAFLFAGIILGVFTDFFFLGVGMTARIFLFGALIYTVPRLFRRMSQLVSESIERREIEVADQQI